ncbi:uncharacterized protein LTR77_004705 [Saxophila tyrrhenica]|uniref:Heterokaryon incompatibility domain-containing protein n=1 Tax=Saxophila tyrrhenica TaxID=1690608 RepID=A0AAV9PA05_9PEZI|nr:hypothetical protein LTR77_004705 [Saxophila tyrrhenica]
MAASAYNPIKDWQIRVLNLHPGHEDDELRGELVTADLFADRDGVVLHTLQEQVDFRALSYTWGPHDLPDLTETIRIGENNVAITPMLRGALGAFRLPGESCYVWVDALCINQNDDTEKNSQVQKMFTIYGRAKSTMVYLGDAGEHTGLAIAHLNRPLLPERQGEQYQRGLFAGLADIYTRPWIRRVK